MPSKKYDQFQMDSKTLRSGPRSSVKKADRDFGQKGESWGRFAWGQDLNLEPVRRPPMWHYKKYQHEQDSIDQVRYGGCPMTVEKSVSIAANRYSPEGLSSLSVRMACLERYYPCGHWRCLPVIARSPSLRSRGNSATTQSLRR